MGASGIRFDNYFFTEPVSLASWTPPKCAGLFGILIDDPHWAPKAFQPIYFGEFGNNAPASLVLQDCGPVIASAVGKTLFVSVLPMLFSTSQQRWTLRNQLVRAYNPVCQVEQPSAVEQKHQDQTAQLLGLTSDAPRRRIGFVS